MIIDSAMYIVESFSWLSVVSILVLFFGFYGMYFFCKLNNSSYLVAMTTIVLAVCAVLAMFKVPAISDIVMLSVSFIPLYWVVFFRSELKLAVWKRSIGNKNAEIAVQKFTGSEYEVRKCIATIIKALQNMSKKNVGALVVVIPSIIPMQIAESGVMINGDLSTEIMENIFTPNTPLHDGAMLISGNKILAAGCFLPLSQDSSIPKDLGTRHRAGIGITEMTDVLALIVSEETGVISMARRGTLSRYADVPELTDMLEQIYGLKEIVE